MVEVLFSKANGMYAPEDKSSGLEPVLENHKLRDLWLETS